MLTPSTSEYWRTAEITPTGTPIRVAMNMAAVASLRVVGKRVRISSNTGRLV